MHAPRSWHWKYLTLFFAACAMLADSAVAQDQNSPAKRIGVLMSETAEGVASYTGAFVQGMRELGWIEGKTPKFIMRFDYDNKSQLPKLAAELVALGVDVLAATSVATPAARSATTTTPIVAMDTYDPVSEGLTSDLGKPRGNNSELEDGEGVRPDRSRVNHNGRDKDHSMISSGPIPQRFTDT